MVEILIALVLSAMIRSRFKNRTNKKEEILNIFLD